MSKKALAKKSAGQKALATLGQKPVGPDPMDSLIVYTSHRDKDDGIQVLWPPPANGMIPSPPGDVVDECPGLVSSDEDEDNADFVDINNKNELVKRWMTLADKPGRMEEEVEKIKNQGMGFLLIEYELVKRWMTLADKPGRMEEEVEKIKNQGMGLFLLGMETCVPTVWVQVMVMARVFDNIRSVGELELMMEKNLMMAEIAMEIFGRVRHVFFPRNKGFMEDVLYMIDYVEKNANSGGIIELPRALQDAMTFAFFKDEWNKLKTHEKVQKYLKLQSSDNQSVITTLLFFYKLVHHHVVYYGNHKGTQADRIVHELFQKQEFNTTTTKELGNKYFKNKEYDEAVKMYSALMIKDYANHIVYGNRAQCYIYLKDYTRAYCDCRRAIFLNPNWPKGHYRCAEALLHMGRVEEALTHNESARQACQKNQDQHMDQAKLKSNYLEILKQRVKIINGMERKPIVTEYDLPRMREKTEEAIEAFTKKSGEHRALTSMMDGLHLPLLNSNSNNSKDKTKVSANNSKDKTKMPSRPQELTEEDKYALCLREALEGVNLHNRLRAAGKYQAALQLWNQSDNLREKNCAVGLRYAFAITAVSVDQSRTLVLEGLQVLQGMQRDDLHTVLPLVLYGLGRAFIALYRFPEAWEVVKGDVTKKQRKVWREVCWPGSQQTIPESKLDVFLREMAVLKGLCRLPPKPNAVCFQHVDHDNENRNIYLSSPTHSGLVRMYCYQRCVFAFHVACWKEYRAKLSADKISEKEVIDRPCPTPDCGSFIFYIMKERPGKKALEFTSEQRPSKPHRSHKAGRMLPSNPDKIARRRERKETKKQKRSEAARQRESPLKPPASLSPHDIIHNLVKKRSDSLEWQQENNAEASAVAPAPNAMVILHKQEDDDLKYNTFHKQVRQKKKKEKETRGKSVLDLGFNFTDTTEREANRVGEQEADAQTAQGDRQWDKPPRLTMPQHVIQPAAVVEDKPFAVPPSIRHQCLSFSSAVSSKPSQDPGHQVKEDHIKSTFIRFVYDFLKEAGPQQLEGELIKQLLEDVPEEVTRVIKQYGGVRLYFQRHCEFVVIGDYVGVIDDQEKVQQCATRLHDQEKARKSSTRLQDPIARPVPSSGSADFYQSSGGGSSGSGSFAAAAETVGGGGGVGSAAARTTQESYMFASRTAQDSQIYEARTMQQNVQTYAARTQPDSSQTYASRTQPDFPTYASKTQPDSSQQTYASRTQPDPQQQTYASRMQQDSQQTYASRTTPQQDSYNDNASKVQFAAAVAASNNNNTPPPPQRRQGEMTFPSPSISDQGLNPTAPEFQPSAQLSGLDRSANTTNDDTDDDTDDDEAYTLAPSSGGGGGGSGGSGGGGGQWAGMEDIDDCDMDEIDEVDMVQPSSASHNGHSAASAAETAGPSPPLLSRRSSRSDLSQASDLSTGVLYRGGSPASSVSSTKGSNPDAPSPFSHHRDTSSPGLLSASSAAAPPPPRKTSSPGLLPFLPPQPFSYASAIASQSESGDSFVSCSSSGVGLSSWQHSGEPRFTSSSPCSSSGDVLANRATPPPLPPSSSLPQPPKPLKPLGMLGGLRPSSPSSFSAGLRTAGTSTSTSLVGMGMGGGNGVYDRTAASMMMTELSSSSSSSSSSLLPTSSSSSSTVIGGELHHTSSLSFLPSSAGGGGTWGSGGDGTSSVSSSSTSTATTTNGWPTNSFPSALRPNEDVVNTIPPFPSSRLFSQPPPLPPPTSSASSSPTPFPSFSHQPLPPHSSSSSSPLPFPSFSQPPPSSSSSSPSPAPLPYQSFTHPPPASSPSPLSFQPTMAHNSVFSPSPSPAPSPSPSSLASAHASPFSGFSSHTWSTSDGWSNPSQDHRGWSAPLPQPSAQDLLPSARDPLPSDASISAMLLSNSSDPSAAHLDSDADERVPGVSSGRGRREAGCQAGVEVSSVEVNTDMTERDVAVMLFQQTKLMDTLTQLQAMRLLVDQSKQDALREEEEKRVSVREGEGLRTDLNKAVQQMRNMDLDLTRAKDAYMNNERMLHTELQTMQEQIKLSSMETNGLMLKASQLEEQLNKERSRAQQAECQVIQEQMQNFKMNLDKKIKEAEAFDQKALTTLQSFQDGNPGQPLPQRLHEYRTYTQQVLLCWTQKKAEIMIQLKEQQEQIMQGRLRSELSPICVFPTMPRPPEGLAVSHNGHPPPADTSNILQPSAQQPQAAPPLQQPPSMGEPSSSYPQTAGPPAPPQLRMPAAPAPLGGPPGLSMARAPAPLRPPLGSTFLMPMASRASPSLPDAMMQLNRVPKPSPSADRTPDTPTPLRPIFTSSQPALPKPPAPIQPPQQQPPQHQYQHQPPAFSPFTSGDSAPPPLRPIGTARPLAPTPPLTSSQMTLQMASQMTLPHPPPPPGVASTATGRPSSFDKMVLVLQRSFPNLEREHFQRAVMELRRAHNGSLTGLDLELIVSRVKQMLIARGFKPQGNAATSTTSTKVPSTNLNNNQHFIGGGDGEGGRLVAPPPGLSAAWSVEGVEPEPSPLVLSGDRFVEEEDPCAICFNELSAQPVQTLECMHRFHDECIRTWFKQKTTCPKCRTHAPLLDEFPPLK